MELLEDNTSVRHARLSPTLPEIVSLLLQVLPLLPLVLLPPLGASEPSVLTQPPRPLQQVVMFPLVLEHSLLLVPPLVTLLSVQFALPLGLSPSAPRLPLDFL